MSSKFSHLVTSLPPPPYFFIFVWGVKDKTSIFPVVKNVIQSLGAGYYMLLSGGNLENV